MKDRHLWLRIAAADLPEGFEEKLRDEFSWTQKATADAIEEYRRFVYLNQVAEHPLSPPREVDLVWHMHLVYPRHYWGPWHDMLTTDMHHEPAAPSTPDSAFRDAYGDTRALYLQEFDSFAQDRIWPTVAELKRKDRAGAFAVLCFFVTFVAGIIGGVTNNLPLIIVAIVAFVMFVIAIIFASSKNGGRTSFGVSTGSGGDGGCGD